MGRVSFIIVLVSSIFFSGLAHGEGLKEMWYMNRGRSNMKIKNYKAAIEAFEHAIEQNPKNKEASHTLGVAYQNQGMNDKALGQFEKHLKKYPEDSDIAFRAATILGWRRYSYRKAEAIRYYRMGLKNKNDPIMRQQYAQLLSSSKETSAEAIRQYKRLIGNDPKNGGLHRGIAKAYAWVGEKDKALYHTNLAIEYGATVKEIGSLKSSLAEGREPRAGGDFLFFIQSEAPFDLNGIQLSGLGQMDLGPFVTLKAKAGLEKFWNKNEEHSGSFINLQSIYRYSKNHSFEGKLGFHNFQEDGTEYTLQYNYVGDEYTFRPGFKKELRYDSYMALVGSDTTGEFLGAARNNKVYTSVEGLFREIPFKLTPYVGWVSSVGEAANAMVRADLKLEFQLRNNSNKFIDSHTHFSHYSSEHSGFTKTSTEPLSGGYFSPKFYFDQTIHLRRQWTTNKASEWRVEVGPAIQYENGFKLGASLLGNYTRKTSDKLYLQVETKYKQVSSTYRRFTIYSSLLYVF